MKPLRYLLSILAVLTLIVGWLVLSIEICCFSDRGFFTKQYEKEQSYQTVGMSLPDLTAMTDHMLDYLQDKNDDLSYITTMWGQSRDFFNDREKAHMVDVKNLNLGAVRVMKLCFLITALLLLTVLYLCHRQHPAPGWPPAFFQTLARSMLWGTVVFVVILGLGTVYAVSDFEAFWIRFHTIFFTNDLWYLDPARDMLINVTTESLFAALVARIAILFVLGLALLLLCSALYLLHHRSKKGGTALLLLLLLPGLTRTAYAADSITALDDAPMVNATSAILIDAETGHILYAKNEKEAAFPASTTKVMTALLALENAGLDERVTLSKSAVYALTPGASHIGMKIGEEISMEDALYGLLLPSANEVANAIAEHVDGSMKDFVEHMNARAAELGCVNTHFANPNGLHDANHTTCAYDLAKIFQTCINTTGFQSIDSQTTHVIGPTNLVEESRPMRTTHEMMRSDSPNYDSRVVCGKTGHTDEALGCLITYAQDGGNSLICVVLHATQPSQYSDTKLLLDYGFQHFSHTTPAALSEYLFASADAPYFRYCESGPVPLYTIESDALLLLPSDLSLVQWEFESKTPGDNGRIHLSTGSLDLGYVKYRVSTLASGIYDQGLTPMQHQAAIQPDQRSVWVPFLIITLLVIAVIALTILILRSRTVTNLRKKRSTHIVRNPGTNTIKIK